MKTRSYYNLSQRMPASKPSIPSLGWLAVAMLVCWAWPLMAGSDAPQWMHALTSVSMPSTDEKTDAVLLYDETIVSVQSADRLKKTVRLAYKILRPGGRDYGIVAINMNVNRKVTSLHGWCIPAQGKDYEVKDKDGVEVSPPKIEGSELVTDVKYKVIRIPAPDPGNIIGYEYETEERPLALQDTWMFQSEVPVRESRYTLQLPAGWEYKASWLNAAETKPAIAGSQSQWVVNNLAAIRKEEEMPPFRGVAGQMVVSFFPPGGAAANGFSDWRQMGTWYAGLTAGRTDASPDIKQRVQALTSSGGSSLDKMRAVAQFMQREVRYVAIELGIGGLQPHPASEVFAHRYGDCKDKATLMRSMLHEIGVESYYIIINTERGSVTADTPANHNAFDHVILAIRLPDDLKDSSLVATATHPKLGRLLFFDPTNELIPFGHVAGHLQANYGLLVGPDGGELIQVPREPPSQNGIQRNAKLALNSNGLLEGVVEETRTGDRAWAERSLLLSVTRESEKIHPIETLLANSMANFRIVDAKVANLKETDKPFGFNYSFEARDYARHAGNLLLVRPRVLGSKASGILETKDPRRFAVEFEGPVKDVDNFEIALPPGYVVDELPPPVDADFEFASYHSRTEAKGNTIAYTRTFEIKELSVPVSKVDELRKFYRIIAGDERNTAVLKPPK